MSNKELIKLIEFLPMEEEEKKILTEIIEGDDPENVLEKLLQITEDDKWLILNMKSLEMIMIN